MTPEQYDAWYDTPRGRWIGELEWTAVRNALRLQPSDIVLDVGCGTGWFTRRADHVDRGPLLRVRLDDSDSRAARLLEQVMPETLPFGCFLLLAGQRGPGLVSSAR